MRIRSIFYITNFFLKNYYIMDNRYKNCPPKMNNSRFMTDYVPHGLRNHYVFNNGNFKSEYDFTNYMQKHGISMLNQEWESIKSRACHPTVCLFNSPLVTSNESDKNELDRYNKYQRGIVTSSECRKFEDYRLFNEDEENVKF